VYFELFKVKKHQGRQFKMKKSHKVISLLLSTSLLYTAAGCTKQQKTNVVSLNISAAASLKDSMDEIKELYKAEKSNVVLRINYGSSGVLQQQIEQGADVDVFISAAPKQMDALESKDLIIKDTRKDFLLNNVVLVVPKENSAITGFNDLTSDKVNKIAIGEPKSVPAGQYAEEIFTKLDILNKVKPKVVYGNDVKQVLTWVETGNADAGIVYSTDAKVSNKVKVIVPAPSNSHAPVIYPAAIVKTSKNGDADKDFMKFLTSDKAKAVFEKYGFQMNTK
jgi:molybdate transport system substrate-binding protein